MTDYKATLHETMQHAVLDDNSFTEEEHRKAANNLEEILVMMGSGSDEIQAAAYCLSQYPIANYKQNLKLMNGNGNGNNLTTMATDGVRLYFNPTFVNNLWDSGQVVEISTINGHELGHMMLMHPAKMLKAAATLQRRGVEISLEFFMTLDNLILDVVVDDFADIGDSAAYINKSFLAAHSEHVKASFSEIIDQMINMIKLHKQEHDPYFHNKAFEVDYSTHAANLDNMVTAAHGTDTSSVVVQAAQYIWEHLMEPNKEVFPQGGSALPGAGGAGNHVVLPPEAMREGEDGQPQIDISQSDQIADGMNEKMHQTLEQCQQVIGNTPLGADITPPSLSPSKVPLAEKFRDCIPDLQDKSSMRRTHPAFGARRIMLPARTHGEPSVILAMDCSGSVVCDEEVLQELMSEAVGAMRSAGLRKVHFIPWDTVAYKIQDVEVGQPLPPLDTFLVGGGGTDATCAMELAVEKLSSNRDIAAIVFMTDGYVSCNFTEADSPWPIIWLFSKNYSPEHVRTLPGSKITIFNNREF